MSNIDGIKEQIKSLSVSERAEMHEWMLLEHDYSAGKSTDLTETEYLLSSPRNAQRLLRALRRAQGR